jgi:hypothetical protein
MDRKETPHGHPFPPHGAPACRAARTRARPGVAALAASTVAGALLAGGPAFAATATHHTAAAATYTFTTLDDQADPTFNQLLGSDL